MGHKAFSPRRADLLGDTLRCLLLALGIIMEILRFRQWRLLFLMSGIVYQRPDHKYTSIHKHMLTTATTKLT